MYDVHSCQIPQSQRNQLRHTGRYRQAGVEAEQSLQIFKMNMLYEKNR